MSRLFPFFVLVLFAQGVLAELTIKNLRFEPNTDELIIDVSFQGKCLPHQLMLHHLESREGTHRYFLALSNDGKDPCNGEVKKSQSFPLTDIQRPAEILVSTQADGSRPFAIRIGTHAKAQILGAQFIDGMLEARILASGGISQDRFYLDLDQNCVNNSSCEAFIRDKRPSHDAKKQSHTIRLSLEKLKRPITLSFKTTHERTVRLHIP